MFSIRTLTQHINILASFLPNGKTFIAKNIENTKLRKFLKGLSGTTQDIDEVVNSIINDYDITTTINEDSILLWEKAVGIPDECFDTSQTLEIRAKQVIAKLIAKGVQTDVDFINILKLFDETITITPLSSSGFHPPYAVPFIPVNSRARFVMIVKGDNIEGQHPPYAVPFIPQGNQSLVQCIIDKLKPAHVKVLYINN